MDITGLSDYTSYLTSSLADTSATNLENKLNQMSSTDDTSDDELMEVCKEFESYLWEQVLKEMEKSLDWLKDDDEDSYASNMVDTFSDTAIQTIAAQMTEQSQGNNSLAQMLYEQMKVSYEN